MKPRVIQAVELRPDQLQYLEKMGQEHGLPDVSKTVRVLVSYAMATPEREADIFGVIRCASPEECSQDTQAAAD